HEKSGVEGGSTHDLGVQAEKLASFLRLEPGTYVFHRSGWGVGRIVEYLADRGRCVIDFRDKPHHEMDIEAASQRLDHLDGNDIRALSMSDPKGLRRLAAAQPLDMIKQVLARFAYSTRLRHVKEALVPDAVATSRWSAWWKDAKRLAQRDPRFHVGSGRDPVLEYSDTADVDFTTQIERSFRGCATVEERQRAARELIAASGDDAEAREALSRLVEAERAKATKPATALGWDLVRTAIEGGDESETIRQALGDSDGPLALLVSIQDDDARAAAGRVLVATHEDGAQMLFDALIERDDPILANVAVDRFASAGYPEFLPRLLDRVDTKPALHPNLWAWYVRGLRRQRWEGRTYEPYALVRRLLKVLDAVEYRNRRKANARDRRGVAALVEILTTKGCALVKDAVEAGGADGARHIIMVAETNRGLKGRQMVKVQDTILRARPDALRERVDEEAQEGEIHVGERLDRIYMTPEGITRLTAERDRILNEEMPSNAKEIARAREFGDLSENAEYHAAREKQAMLQAKADALGSDLARAVPLSADLVNTEAVSVGTRVTLRDEADGEITYTLLGPADADVKRGIVNYLTPLGQAIMGRKPGDTVQVSVDGATRDLVILRIENALS
ncbi:MAG: GreA/GreB family elongation factor, partial [Planctomycetota bacterium]